MSEKPQGKNISRESFGHLSKMYLSSKWKPWFSSSLEQHCPKELSVQFCNHKTTCVCWVLEISLVQLRNWIFNSKFNLNNHVWLVTIRLRSTALETGPTEKLTDILKFSVPWRYDSLSSSCRSLTNRWSKLKLLFSHFYLQTSTSYFFTTYSHLSTVLFEQVKSG